MLCPRSDIFQSRSGDNIWLTRIEGLRGRMLHILCPRSDLSITQRGQHMANRQK